MMRQLKIICAITIFIFGEFIENVNIENRWNNNFVISTCFSNNDLNFFNVLKQLSLFIF